MQLSYCHARFVLLLHISQTRVGATAVLNAGLFHSIQASGFFSMDPDLGVGKSLAVCFILIVLFLIPRNL